ncbi:MAG: hypothetical protein ACXADD_17915 [Candidatus Thorarchaeota archaeon]
MKPRLAFSIFVMTALFLTLAMPVSAAQPDYMVRANGDIVSFVGVEPPEVQGHWTLFVRDVDIDPGPHHPDVNFNAFYDVKISPTDTIKIQLTLLSFIDFDIDPVPGGDPDPEWWLFMVLGTMEVTVLEKSGAPVVWYIQHVRVTIHRDLLASNPDQAFFMEFDDPYYDVVGSVDDRSIMYYSLIG